MKTAIVTGAAGNLGQAVVKKFISEGYKVIGTTTKNNRINHHFAPGTFETAVVDLTDEKATQEFIGKVVASHGHIDAAILTVGGFAIGTIKDTSLKDIQQQIQLNFETVFNAARPIFAQMLSQNKGRIFLLGSKPGLSVASSKGMVAYGIAKSLVFRLAELMNDEAKGTDVVTAVIVPGTIDTTQNREALPHADFNKWVTPEQIADVIYFYTTPQAQTLREPVIKIYNNG